MLNSTESAVDFMTDQIKTHIVGLTGKAGAGKNYVASLLALELDRSASIALADPLKDMCAEMFGVDRRNFYDQDKKRGLSWYRWEWLNRPPEGKTGLMTHREILQYVGTELVRDTWSRQHWLRLAGLTVARCKAASVSVIVTDVRFPNEADHVREWGGKVWEVHGRAYDNTPTHSSEAIDQIKPDYVIRNPVGTTDKELLEQIRAGLAS